MTHRGPSFGDSSVKTVAVWQVARHHLFVMSHEYSTQDNCHDQILAMFPKCGYMRVIRWLHAKITCDTPQTYSHGNVTVRS